MKGEEGEAGSMEALEMIALGRETGEGGSMEEPETTSAHLGTTRTKVGEAGRALPAPMGTIGACPDM